MSARTAHSTTGAQTAARNQVEIRRLLEPASVRAWLEPLASYSAYAIAYLDSRLLPLAEFYEAIAGEKRALVMHARGGLGPSTFALGEPRLVAALMRLHPGPRQAFITCETSHVDLLLETHNLWRPQTMLRMRVDRDAYHRPEGLPQARRLIDADAAELNRLYALEDDGLRYSGRQVREGIYYGAYSRGRLVAAAGTHIYSRDLGVAVVGNVFAHPDYRGHGFGTAVTAAVVEHLLAANGRLIVLNVDPANRTAHHIYETLGFSDQVRLVEAMITRRASLSPIPLMRRALARWRAEKPGAEVVEV